MTNTGDTSSSRMRCEVFPIIPLSCLQTGESRVSAHLGEPKGWRRSSSRPWPHHPVSWWLTYSSLLFKQIKIKLHPKILFHTLYTGHIGLYDLYKII
ncbi:hypothetical protein Hanom_Chr01g00056061 [Helianthus anomalus]